LYRSKVAIVELSKLKGQLAQKEQLKCRGYQMMLKNGTPHYEIRCSYNLMRHRCILSAKQNHLIPKVAGLSDCIVFPELQSGNIATNLPTFGQL